MKEVTFNSLIRNKLIKEELVRNIGEDGLILIEILFNAKKFVSEFTLAEHSGIYVNTVRSLLYKLYEYKIVTYSRKREKNRGWYIYSWKLFPSKLVAHVIKKLRDEISSLKKEYHNKPHDEYFYCKDCDIKLSFTEAMEYNFACPNCFKQMELTSPKKENKQIKQRIKELEEEIKTLTHLKDRLEVMEEKIREEEREKQRKEEEERKALEAKGMYYCTECEKTHKINSKIGEAHKEFAK